MPPSRKRAYIELLIVAGIWGCASTVIKYTLGGFLPGVFLIYRFLISSIIAICFFIFFGIKLPKDKKTLTFVLINGFLLSTVDLGLLFLGANKTTAIDSNIISAMSPVVVAIAGVLFLKERVTKRESLGLLVALAGTFITVIEPIVNGGGFVGLEGNLLIFAHILVGATTAVIAKKLLRNGVDAITATNMSFIVGFVTTLPIVLFYYPLGELVSMIALAPFNYHLGVFYMAAISGTLAYILWHRAEKSIEVSEVGLFAYLYPIFGVPLSLLWLGERVTLPFVIGCIVIATGVFLAEWKKTKN